METQYHLILIAEYFDESLAVLKHKLCWSYKDIITVAAAVKRPTNHLTGNELVLDSDLKEKLKNFNKARVRSDSKFMGLGYLERLVGWSGRWFLVHCGD